MAQIYLTDDFARELKRTFGSQQTNQEIIRELSSLHQGKSELLLAYIDQFESLREQLVETQELQRPRPLVTLNILGATHMHSGDAMPTAPGQDGAPTGDAEDANSQTREARDPISETLLTQFFIDGVTDHTLCFHVKQVAGLSLANVIAVAHAFDDEPGPRSPEHDSDSDDDNLEEDPPKRTSKLDTVIAGLEKMTLMLMNNMKSQKSLTQGNGNTSTFCCFNCNETMHMVRECKNPCKYCKGSHRHYECNQYRPKTRATTTARESALLIAATLRNTNTDDLLAVKRGHDETKITADTSSAPAVCRLRVNGPKPPVQQIISQSSLPPAAAPIVIDSPKPTTNAHTRSTLAESRLTASDVVNRPVFQVSIAQMADLSPRFRTQVKAVLTKPHKKPIKVDTATLMMFSMDHVSNYTSEPPNRSIRRTITHAPATQGTINGQDVEMILDGGATACIISLNLVMRLGIEELKAADKTLMLGDGQVVQPISIATDLEVMLGGVSSCMLDALCLDISSYDFLVGRHALHELKVGTDWYTHQWWVRNDQGSVHPLPTEYDKERPASGDQDKEVFFLVPVTDEYEATAPPLEADNPLGDLLQRITSNTNLNELEKTQLSEVILNNKDAFGTSYAHLTQTDLVTFHVDTGSAKPVYRRPYQNFSHVELEFLKRDIQQMIANGILVPATHTSENARSGGWSSPCRYVRKRDGTFCLVSNFKSLNAVTIRDPWPITNLTNLLESMAHHKPHEPIGELSRIILVDFESQIEKLDRLFKRIIEVKMKLNANKCDFGRRSIELLGFEVSKNGIKPLAP
ncbi:hypothetical protein BJV82DRAFT_583251 [Fennellomyces sp. T-0311]|nr:hypothetical protein BJV82DRAFT_583251 [Fennellomyces sp. T-0311]